MSCEERAYMRPGQSGELAGGGSEEGEQPLEKIGFRLCILGMYRIPGKYGALLVLPTCDKQIVP
jgi:hypothetical protein